VTTTPPFFPSLLSSFLLSKSQMKASDGACLPQFRARGRRRLRYACASMLYVCAPLPRNAEPCSAAAGGVFKRQCAVRRCRVVYWRSGRKRREAVRAPVEAHRLVKAQACLYGGSVQ